MNMRKRMKFCHLIRQKKNRPVLPTPNGFSHIATILAEAGANPKDVQYRLGHKSLKETLEIYEHVTEKMHKDSTQLIEKVFN